jgi:hypothetical protein
MCDASAIADIITTSNNTNDAGVSGTPVDSLVTDLPAAFSGPQQSSSIPALQNPIFMLTGQ